MEVRRSILPVLGCLLLLSGCRTSQHVTMLEQELRLQEDRIYQLQGCLEEAQTALNRSQEENQSLRQGLIEAKKEDDSSEIRSSTSSDPSGQRAAHRITALDWR